MGAPELLYHLRYAGLVLTLTPAGGLHVAPRGALTDNHRAAIRAERDALVLVLRAEAEQPPSPRRSGNPLMTAEQGDECHAGGWDDTEIHAFTTRVLQFMRKGIEADLADDLAERLTLRDRERDAQHLCLECRNYRPGRCANYARAGLHAPEVGLDLATRLQRCAGFQTER